VCLADTNRKQSYKPRALKRLGDNGSPANLAQARKIVVVNRPRVNPVFFFM
jgi:hypothetical protein